MTLEEILNTKKWSSEEILLKIKNFDDQADLYVFDRNEAYKKLKVFVEYFIDEYREKINQFHQINYPYSFYFNILSPYMWYITSVVYKKYIQRKNGKKNNEIFEFFNGQEKRIFETSEDFFNNIFSNISFNQWLDFILSKHLENSVPLASKVERNLNIEPYYEKEIFKFKEKITRQINKNRYFVNICGFSIYQNFLISFVFQIKCLFKKSDNNDILDHESKCKFKELESSQDFLKILDEVIERTIPISFLEEFKNNIKDQENKLYRNKVLFDRVSVYYADSIIFHSLRKIHGKAMYFVQHGAGYFTYFPYVSIICEFLCDKFFSWGSETYAPDARCQFATAPSPLLSRLMDTHSQENEKLVFVGTNINPLWDGILYPNPFYLVQYLREKKSFFSQLNKNIFDLCLYKLYPSPNYKNFEEKKFISQLFPDLKILDKDEHIDAKIKSSKLIVVGHFDSTTFYKCMAANTPIICYNGFPFFEFYPKAQEVNERFKAQNIFFDTAEEATKFINNNWHQIDSWWNSSDIQNLRQEFCKLYAQCSKTYFLDWIKIILKLKI